MVLDFCQIKFDSQDDLSLKIFSLLEFDIADLQNDETITFDFSGCSFNFDIAFTELFYEDSRGYKNSYQNSKYFSTIEDILEGISNDPSMENRISKYELIFKFDNAAFYKNAKFNYLRCTELTFQNVKFKKGALFRFVDINNILYEPRELGADVTFYHRDKANIEEGILRGKPHGKIETFQYRHALEGNGFTFFVGVNFTKEAKFMDAVLDKVQFSHLDKESLSKCFFANSMLEDTKFYNCQFEFQENESTFFDKNGWYKQESKIISIFILFCVLLCALLYRMPDVLIISALPLAGILNAVMFMPLMKLLSKISSINRHISIGDDISMSKKQDAEDAESNYYAIREIYRQLRVNFEKHGDFQAAGDFFYSQRYTELLTFGSKNAKFFLQWNLLGIHHIVNGFGERWFRAFVWFLLTIVGFTFLYTPNVDFVSSKSTPEYFLNAYNEKTENTTNRLYFDEDNTTTDPKKAAHFILIAKTSYLNNEKPPVTKETNTTKSIYAFDNRFDYHFTEQYIPMLSDGLIRITFSFTKMLSPFVAEEKNWFTARSSSAHYLGIIESIMLWFLFGAFVLAVKNRIKR